MVYGYIRVSTDKQCAENQRYEIQRFCDRHNLHVDVWTEETVSGTKKVNGRKLGTLLKKMKKKRHPDLHGAVKARPEYAAHHVDS